MKLSKAAETQRMSHRGFQSLCHIRVPHRATPAYVVVTSSDLDTSRNKASVSGLSWISRNCNNGRLERSVELRMIHGLARANTGANAARGRSARDRAGWTNSQRQDVEIGRLRRRRRVDEYFVHRKLDDRFCVWLRVQGVGAVLGRVGFVHLTSSTRPRPTSRISSTPLKR